MLRKILTSVLAISVLASSSAFAMSGSIYDVDAGVEVLSGITLSNWQDGRIGRCMVSESNGAIQFRSLVSGENYGSSIDVGNLIYAASVPNGLKSWTFENANQGIFVQSGESSQISSPELAPEGVWASHYTTGAYWCTPSAISISSVEYTNVATGDYNGERNDSAPGSTRCLKVGVGANDWNCQSLGIKVKLSRADVQPGETYVLTFWAMDSAAERNYYAAFTVPSFREPTTAGGGNDWNAEIESAQGKITRTWNKFTVEVSPEERHFEDGYTTLWIGASGPTINRSEKMYFDNIVMYNKNSIGTKDLSVSVKIKNEKNDTEAADSTEVTATFMGEEIISFADGTPDDSGWINYDGVITLDQSNEFFISESGGSTTAGNGAFNITVSTEGAGKMFLKDLSVINNSGTEAFKQLDTVAGSKVEVTADILADEDADCNAILAIIAPGYEQILSTQSVQLTEGANSVTIKANLPASIPTGAMLAVYVADAMGEILSERMQSVAELFKNGANIATASGEVYEGLQIYGAGEYLVEFTYTPDPENDPSEVSVTIGDAAVTAPIENGNGICEIIITEADIDAMSADTAVVIDGISAADITLKKVRD